ncbi:hypothetical protein CCHR01_03657 [Colletotrichum chrysophilum]|uniref:Uncharacterized protein n=1 Tax=Colletotrichum chrysophilum TaxID=1836956 RepID=A0AAD9EM64_9PEZI|nr:hypothetical protein CCHR01_03657 [Colletotrichum chrysophilum]
MDPYVRLRQGRVEPLSNDSLSLGNEHEGSEDAAHFADADSEGTGFAGSDSSVDNVFEGTGSSVTATGFEGVAFAAGTGSSDIDFVDSRSPRCKDFLGTDSPVTASSGVGSASNTGSGGTGSVGGDGLMVGEADDSLVGEFRTDDDDDDDGVDGSGGDACLSATMKPVSHFANHVQNASSRFDLRGKVSSDS